MPFSRIPTLPRFSGEEPFASNGSWSRSEIWRMCGSWQLQIAACHFLLKSPYPSMLHQWKLTKLQMFATHGSMTGKIPIGNGEMVNSITKTNGFGMDFLRFQHHLFRGSINSKALLKDVSLNLGKTSDLTTSMCISAKGCICMYTRCIFLCMPAFS